MRRCSVNTTIHARTPYTARVPATSATAVTRWPNLLFVMMDQLQARALGCYGNPVCQTPHLDRLAAGGTSMERFFVTQALCVPSRCSLFTGRYVHAHRHQEPSRADVARAGPGTATDGHGQEAKHETDW